MLTNRPLNVGFDSITKVIHSEENAGSRENGSRPVRRQRVAFWVGSFAIFTGLASCAMTRVDGKHPLMQSTGTAGAARVYFLRRPTERNLGIPDNPVAVELNDVKLLDLAKGEYTAVALVPRDYTVVLRNDTEVGPNWQVKEMVKRFRFDFQEGRTYFVAVSAVDGEFRGVFFEAQLVDLTEAKHIARRLRPVNGAEPVESLNPSTTPVGEPAAG